MKRSLVALAVFSTAGIVAAAQASLKSGLVPSAFDRSVRPQDDLFRHVNGGWLARTEIPADRATWGTFVEISDKTERDLRGLLEEPAPSGPEGQTRRQLAALYQSFMDEITVNRLGAAPVQPRLAEIDAVTTPGEFAVLAGRFAIIGVAGPVNAFVEADAGDPSRTTLYLSQGGTALPDRDYYLQDTPQFAQTRAKYQQYLETVFGLAGRQNAAADARAVLALETELARVQWTRVESRDALKTYNRYPQSTLLQDMPGFDWLAWGRVQGFDRVGEWIVSEPSFFKSFAALVPTTPLATWKAWLAAQVITHNAPNLSQPFIDAHFDLFARTLTGQQAQRDRWKRGIQLANAEMGDALGRLYAERYFPAESRSRMEGMVRNLLEAYRRSISGLDWMTPATKERALAKLAKFGTKIGYPNKWRDFSRLEVTPNDLIGNVERANRVESDYQVGKLGRPVDREEWLMTPQTVNAYYNELKNEIVFPAAILQPPFFDVTADDAVNYGAIGAVIGHEIGHGFDDQGRRYDGDGRLRDWWSPQDESEFQTRVKRLVDQFNGYSPLPGITVNGQLTLGENIGDLGGLSISYQAWKISIEGRTSPVIDDLTGDQRFFMGWAQAWRAKARDEYLRRQVLADPHAWAEFRANGPLRNIAAFYDAFGVTPGDRLYLVPEDRVKIW